MNEDEEIWKDLEHRSFCPLELGCATMQTHECIHQSRSCLYLKVQEYLWRFHHAGMVNDPSSVPSLSLPLKDGGGAERFRKFWYF